MILRSLKMTNFRSYGKALIQFSPNQNYFFGRNWQGKTSIMEAIGFGLFGKTIFPGKIAGSAVKTDNLVREGSNDGFVELKQHISPQTVSLRNHACQYIGCCPSGSTRLLKFRVTVPLTSMECVASENEPVGCPWGELGDIWTLAGA